MNGEKKYWLDEPKNVGRVIKLLVAVCVGLLVADFLYEKHTHFDWEGWPLFHAVFGFVAFALAVLLGKQLRRIVMRKEDYYDDE